MNIKIDKNKPYNGFIVNYNLVQSWEDGLPCCPQTQKEFLDILEKQYNELKLQLAIDGYHNSEAVKLILGLDAISDENVAKIGDNYKKHFTNTDYQNLYHAISQITNQPIENVIACLGTINFKKAGKVKKEVFEWRKRSIDIDEVGSEIDYYVLLLNHFELFNQSITLATIREFKSNTLLYHHLYATSEEQNNIEKNNFIKNYMN